MITNYYTLFHITAELEHAFSGLTVNEIFTQHRGELVLSFLETPAVIVVGCEPSDNYIYARKSFARARRNSVALFSSVSKTILSKIIIHPTDRQIFFCLIDERKLIIQLFGSKANVLLVDSIGNITERFLKKTDVKVAENDSLYSDLHTVTSKVFLTMYNDQSLIKALKRILPQFGPVLLRELLTRLEINGEQAVNILTEKEASILLSGAQKLIEELHSAPSPRVYFDDASTVEFSIIPLHHLEAFQLQKFDSLSEAIQACRANVHRKSFSLREKEDLTKMLKRECDHIERTLQKVLAEKETIIHAEQYQQYGKLLMAQLHLFKKGDAEVLVEDFISGSNSHIVIPLDQHLTPAKNAGRYFEKAEKCKYAAERQQQRISELTNRQKHMAQLMDRLEEIITTEDLNSFIEENQKMLAPFGLKVNKSGRVEKEEPPPFRIFTVAGGFQVWAGKSGENNDLLSTRHTAKNDLWFHARGVGGSHVVLKVNTGKGEVSKQAIEQAAAIAAYYSKMKKSKLVPVAMCEGKYVRKPKGVPAGTVSLEREKTIFVEPRLPETEE